MMRAEIKGVFWAGMLDFISPWAFDSSCSC